MRRPAGFPPSGALLVLLSLLVHGVAFSAAEDGSNLRFQPAEHSRVVAQPVQMASHVCFTDRRDEMRIDGQWRDATHPPAYHQCTDVLGNAHNSICPTGTAGKPEAPRDFHATSCVLPPMDAQDFAQVIGHGATLWFIGDSISEQMISSLLCLMRAGGFDIVAEKTSKIRCFVMTHLQSKRSVRVCRILTWVSVKLYEDLLLFNANAHHAQTGHQETLVLNFGLHYDKTDYHEIHRALARWQAYTPPTRRKLQLVWRDTSPQHFPEKGGLFNRTTRTVTLPCVPIDDMRAAFTPYANMTRMLSREFPEMRRLPVWSLTAPRFDAHNPHECTHWCLPGVPDEWVRLLYALLKAQTVSDAPAEPADGELHAPQYVAITKSWVPRDP